MKALLGILFALLSTSAAAQSLWVEAGGISYHTDRAAGYQERNPAIGLRWQIDDEWSVQAIRYRNSIHGLSTTVSARWTPVQVLGWRVGVIAGVVDGYDANGGRFVPVVLPTITWRIGAVEAGVIGWPSVEKRGVSGGVAIAFSVRVW